MAPDRTLRLLRAAIVDYRIASSPSTSEEAATRVAEYSEALDAWMSRGGFPPAAWNAGRRGHATSTGEHQ